jgi:hypothetical protein
MDALEVKILYRFNNFIKFEELINVQRTCVNKISLSYLLDETSVGGVWWSDGGVMVVAYVCSALVCRYLFIIRMF